MCVTTRRRILFAPSSLTAARMASTDSSEFIPQSSRSTWSPSANRKTLTRPSSNGIGKRSSNTPSATSLSARSTTVVALSKMAVTPVAFAQEERMSEVQLSPDQIVDALPKYLIPEKAGSTKATIVFDLSGENAGRWWVKIHDGAAESGKGEPPETPSLTLQADSGDWVKIMTGAMDGTSAFMQGKLKIKGDMGLAIKMQTLFKRP